MRREQNIPEQLQGLIDLILSQNLILAEVQLDGITSMPDYDQFLRVEDNIIALSQGYLKVLPKRILKHKTTGEIIDNLNLPVPNWERRLHDMAALVDEETGERLMFETNYYQQIQDPENEGEFIEELIETKQEPYLVPVLQYLKLMISVKPYSEVFETFVHQYVNDIKSVVPDYFTTINPPQISGLT